MYCVLYSVSKWSGQRRGQVASNDMICNDNRPGSAVMFGNFTNHSLQSRMIATVPLCIQQACSDDGKYLTLSCIT